MRGVAISSPAFARIDAMVVLSIVSIFSSIALAGINKNREAASQAQCCNNLRKVSQGWVLYTKTNGHFPRGALGEPLYHKPSDPMPTGDTLANSRGGWMWQILPYTGRKELYQQEHAKSPLDAMTKLYATPVPEYLCPSRLRPNTFTTAHTNPPFVKPFQVVKSPSDYGASNGGGNDGVFDRVFVRPIQPGGKVYNLVKPSDVTDGLSNTMFFAELWVSTDYYRVPKNLPQRTHGRQWPAWAMMGMRDGWPDGTVSFSTVRGLGKNPVTPRHDGYISEKLSGEPFAGSAHPRGMMACAGDGSVHFIAYTIDPAVWVSLCSRNDGAKAEWPTE